MRRTNQVDPGPLLAGGQDAPVSWLPAMGDASAAAAYGEVAALADWCPWLPFADARGVAPREPGV